ncbi:MAG: acylphosphatase [Gemmataceae bacterium]
MSLRMDVIYSGRVQGVGFRATVLQISRQYAVTGYVRNQTDGTVELIAEGDEPELLAFLATIRQRFARHLSGESSHRAQAESTFEGFEIRS